MASDEDEVEEGQLQTPPGTRIGTTDSPAVGHRQTGSANSASDSQAKNRNRFRSRSRSRSPTRRRRSRSRSKRKRSGSRSRSPYPGPVIRDMRRGRGNGRRFGRNRRPFRSDRRRSFSPSRSSSRSPSPKKNDRKSPEVKQPERKPKAEQREVTVPAPVAESVRGPRPEDIKNESKAVTMSFLAMLNEKRQVHKSIPSDLNPKSTTGNHSAEGHGKSSHGFVSTFAPASAGKKNHTNDQTDDARDRVADSKDSNSRKRESDHSPDKKHVSKERVKEPPPAQTPPDSPQHKPSKSKDKKKKSKSSRREEKESKKKKRKDRKRKHSSSESSDDSDVDRKKNRKKDKELTPDTSSGKIKSKKSDVKESEEKKKKEKRKSKRKKSDSDSDRSSNRKKSKKKKAKKSSSKKKKQRRRSSSGSSSSESSSSDDSSSGSESEREHTTRKSGSKRESEKTVKREADVSASRVEIPQLPAPRTPEEKTPEKTVTEKTSPVKKSDSKPVINPKIKIGKIKQATSRRPVRRQEDQATPLDMNKDYGWYQQYYASNYALDPYTAAYYAQYAMITSGDYSNPDISAWLHGYGLAYDPSNTANMPLLPPTGSEAVSDAAGDDKKIEVLTSDVPAAAVEQFYQSKDDQSDQMDLESDRESPSPPPPPPPPDQPRITNLVVETPLILPNGQEVPAGTKQVIVHPHHSFTPI